jgi:hypothetical protein
VQLWAVLVASGGAFGLLALFSALRIEIEARGQGAASGAWIVAGGVAVGPLAIAAVARARTPVHVEFRVFGRKLPPFARRLRRPRAPSSEDVAPQTEPAAPSEPRRARFRLGVLDVVELVAREWRRLELERFDLDLGYGFQDIVLTGKLAGALYALSGALPAPIRVTQRPRFDGADRWELSLAGALRISLGLVLLELVWYILGKWRSQALALRRAAPPSHVETPS